MSCIHVNNCGCPDADETPLGQVDASQVFYHALCTAGATALTCSGSANGVSLETWMETMETKVCESVSWDFSSFDMECLKKRYVITNQAQFVLALDNESCRLNTTNDNVAALTLSIESLATLIQNLTYPQITNNCSIPFDNLTSLPVVVQNLVTDYCNFKTNLVIPVSPSISANNSASISWALSGTLNHILQAGVILSPDADNILEIRPNGLYATAVGGGLDEQELAWDALTNTLSITNGNSVTITYPGAQVLSFDSMTGIVSLSGGGGSIDLSTYLVPAFVETVLAVTLSNAGLTVSQSGTSQHNLLIGINIDAVTNGGNNIAQVTAAGLYVPPTTEHDFAPVDSYSISWNAGTAPEFYHDRTASVVLDPDVANLLSVSAAGLAVFATTVYTADSGLTVTGNNIQLGGALLQNTTIPLSTFVIQLLATTATDNNFQFDDATGFSVYQAGAPDVNTSVLIASNIVRHRSIQLATNFDYLKMTSYSGGLGQVPRLFAGVAVSNQDVGKGSRTNIESSYGVKVVMDASPAFTLDENHMLYMFSGNGAGQNLTLPDPAIVNQNPDGEEIAWLFHIKNFSNDVLDIINTNYPIYTDSLTTISAIGPGEVFVIGIVNNLWVKLN